MTETVAAAGVLSGIKVVDFGHYVAGPLTALMLADQGADVVHVDRPGAVLAESDAFLNRGKRRITLDLKDPADAAVAVRLAAGADVVIENFRPGVMDRLGLGWERLAPLAPRMVYCSLPGFGRDDPRAAVPGWEGVIDAATANCSIRVGQEPPGWDASRPTYSAVPLASNFAAFLAATAVVAALTFRHRAGRGQLIEVPLFHAMFELIGKAGAFVQSDGLAPPKPHGGNGSGTYECADGRYVRMDPIGGSARFLRWLLDAAGEEAWAADGLTDGVRLARHKDLEEQLKDRLRVMFRTRTAPQWDELAAEAGVPLGFIRTCREWLHTPHAQLAGHVVSVTDPVYGQTWMAGLPVRALAAPGGVPRPRRLPDADHDAIVAEADQPAAGSGTATDPATAAAPAAAGAEPAGDVTQAFAGLRVLDLTEILAGPSSGRILGEYGADVIKINGPNSSVTAHGIVNRGKRSILLNVEAERGQAVFWELAARSDVIIQNYPEGTADRYGIGYKHVKARFPDAVFVSVTCFGEGGQWGARRGYETQGQAITGMMERAGGDHHVPEILGPYNVVDFGSGVMTAFAAALGIFHRARTGAGGKVTASLAQTATYHQATFMLDYAGRPPRCEPRGPEALGAGPFQRYYQARDGWIFLGMRPSQWAALRSVSWMKAADGVDPGDAGAVEAALSGAIGQRPAAEAVHALREAGVGAHEVLSTGQVMTREPAMKLGLSLIQQSAEFGPVVMPGLTVRLSESPLVLGRAAGRAGSDARAVLAEVGLADRVSELSRSWVLRTEDLPRAW